MSTKKKKERPLSFINWHSLGFILEIEEGNGAKKKQGGRGDAARPAKYKIRDLESEI